MPGRTKHRPLNADAYKSHSPCNHRLLSRKLLPHLVQYTEEELFLLYFFIHNQQSSTLQRCATQAHGEKWATSGPGSTDPPNGSVPAAAAQALSQGPAARAGHFCARVHGPTEWLRPSCSSAGALTRPCCTGSGSLRAGDTSCGCAGAPGPCCMSHHMSMPGVSGKLPASKRLSSSGLPQRL